MDASARHLSGSFQFVAQAWASLFPAQARPSSSNTHVLSDAQFVGHPTTQHGHSDFVFTCGRHGVSLLSIGGSGSRGILQLGPADIRAGCVIVAHAAETEHSRLAEPDGTELFLAIVSSNLPNEVKLFSITAQKFVHLLKFSSSPVRIMSSSRCLVVRLEDELHVFHPTTFDHITGVPCQPAKFKSRIALADRLLAYPSTRSGKSAVASRNTLAKVTSQYATALHGGVQRFAKDFVSGIHYLSDLGRTKIAEVRGQVPSSGARGIGAAVSAHDAAALRGRGDKSSIGSMSSSHASWSSSDRTESKVTYDGDRKRMLEAAAGTVSVRDVGTGRTLLHFRAHQSPIACLAFDASGTLLATASEDGRSIHVFKLYPVSTDTHSHGPQHQHQQEQSNAPGSKRRAREHRHVKWQVHHMYTLERGVTRGDIVDIAFSEDSSTVAVASRSGTIHIFRISPFGGPAPQLQAHRPHSISVDEESGAVGFRPVSNAVAPPPEIHGRAHDRADEGPVQPTSFDAHMAQYLDQQAKDSLPLTAGDADSGSPERAGSDGVEGGAAWEAVLHTGAATPGAQAATQANQASRAWLRSTAPLQVYASCRVRVPPELLVLETGAASATATAAGASSGTTDGVKASGSAMYPDAIPRAESSPNDTPSQAEARQRHGAGSSPTVPATDGPVLFRVQVFGRLVTAITAAGSMLWFEIRLQADSTPPMASQGAGPKGSSYGRTADPEATSIPTQQLTCTPCGSCRLNAVRPSRSSVESEGTRMCSSGMLELLQTQKAELKTHVAPAVPLYNHPLVRFHTLAPESSADDGSEDKRSARQASQDNGGKRAPLQVSDLFPELRQRVRVELRRAGPVPVLPPAYGQAFSTKHTGGDKHGLASDREIGSVAAPPPAREIPKRDLQQDLTQALQSTVYYQQPAVATAAHHGQPGPAPRRESMDSLGRYSPAMHRAANGRQHRDSFDSDGAGSITSGRSTPQVGIPQPTDGGGAGGAGGSGARPLTSFLLHDSYFPTPQPSAPSPDDHMDEDNDYSDGGGAVMQGSRPAQQDGSMTPSNDMAWLGIDGHEIVAEPSADASDSSGEQNRSRAADGQYMPPVDNTGAPDVGAPGNRPPTLFDSASAAQPAEGAEDGAPPSQLMSRLLMNYADRTQSADAVAMHGGGRASMLLDTVARASDASPELPGTRSRGETVDSDSDRSYTPFTGDRSGDDATPDASRVDRAQLAAKVLDSLPRNDDCDSDDDRHQARGGGGGGDSGLFAGSPMGAVKLRTALSARDSPVPLTVGPTVSPLADEVSDSPSSAQGGASNEAAAKPSMYPPEWADTEGGRAGAVSPSVESSASGTSSRRTGSTAASKKKAGKKKKRKGKR